MQATKSVRRRVQDHARAERWMRRFGDEILYVSADGFALLTRRLEIRRRAMLACAPVLAAAAITLLSPIWRSSDSPIYSPRQFVEGTLAAYALASVATVLMLVVRRRGERKLATSLPQRVSRDSAAPITMILGRIRCWFLLGTGLAEAGLAVTLLVVEPGWAAWTNAAAVLIADGLVGIGLYAVRARATIAVDAVTLTLDERLRSNDAFAAATPLYLVATPPYLSNLLESGAPFWLFAAAMLGGFAIIALWFWVARFAPWGPIRSGSGAPYWSGSEMTAP